MDDEGFHEACYYPHPEDDVTDDMMDCRVPYDVDIRDYRSRLSDLLWYIHDRRDLLTFGEWLYVDEEICQLPFIPSALHHQVQLYNWAGDVLAVLRTLEIFRQEAGGKLVWWWGLTFPPNPFGPDD